MIKQWLKDIETKYKINILFAAETGSRAWGGATEQSDYDVRFIFKHRDVKSYLSLKKAEETFDFLSPVDAHGWDILKTLKLLDKSNPTLLEWAVSPIVYRDCHYFSKKISSYVEESYSLYSLYQHYIHLMTRNIKEMKDKEFTDRSQKKLIQAVRSYLLAMSIMSTREIPLRVLYSSFSGIVSDEDGLVSFYHELMSAKKNRKLVHLDSVTENIIIMETQRVKLDKQAADLPRGKNIGDQLDQWIWELLNL